MHTSVNAHILVSHILVSKLLFLCLLYEHFFFLLLYWILFPTPHSSPDLFSMSAHGVELHCQLLSWLSVRSDNFSQVSSWTSRELQEIDGFTAQNVGFFWHMLSFLIIMMRNYLFHQYCTMLFHHFIIFSPESEGNSWEDIYWWWTRSLPPRGGCDCGILVSFHSHIL